MNTRVSDASVAGRVQHTAVGGVAVTGHYCVSVCVCWSRGRDKYIFRLSKLQGGGDLSCERGREKQGQRSSEEKEIEGKDQIIYRCNLVATIFLPSLSQWFHVHT